MSTSARSSSVTAPVTPGDAATIAKRLAQHYGEEARAIAMDRADALFDLGNAKSARSWMHIADILDEEQRKSALGSI